MNAQLTTSALMDPRAAVAWTALHEAVDAAIKLISIKELAYRLDISPSYLTEALHGLNRKGFRLEWLPTVLLMAPIAAVPPIYAALGDLRGFEFSRKRQMTEAEELAATREALKRLAPAVLVLVDQEIGK